MFSAKRIALSEKVEELLKISKSSAIYDKLLNNNINKLKLDRFIDTGVFKQPVYISTERLQEDIEKLFDLDGVISGGCALSYIHNTHKTKDIDFYFNDDINYVKAYLITYDNPHIDICYYFDEPHELHDMSFVMCNIYKDRCETTPQAKLALDSLVSEIYPENVIWPDRTAERMLKYNKRTNLRFRKEQTVCLCGIYNIEKDLAKKVIEISD